MTETEWFQSDSPIAMLAVVQPHASERKLRLFACSCCRHAVTEPDRSGKDWKRWENGEAKADGLKRRPYKIDTWLTDDAEQSVRNVGRFFDGGSMLRDVGANLVREAFGNPFRPVSLNPAWLAWGDRTSLRLAQSIYDQRAWDQLPILADALMDGDCTDETILSHLRSPGPHVRGCWVLDLLLGKS